MLSDQLCQFAKMLNNLSRFLTLAESLAQAKKFEVEILLNSRLAPDMFPLTRQVQIACDTVKFAVARLSGNDAPVYEDKEKTIPELKARIESTLQFLSSVKEADFAGWEDRKVTTPRWEGKWLTGRDYLHQHVVPNVYFHVTTAYAILRHHGVDIGKKDFLGEIPYQK